MLADAEKKGAAEARKEMQQEAKEAQGARSEEQGATIDRHSIGVESLYLTGTIGGANDAVFNYNADMYNDQRKRMN